MKWSSKLIRLAGIVIIGSLYTAHTMGQINLMNMSWLWLTLFVGANLFQMGFTGFCPVTKVVYAIGLKDKQSGCNL